MPKCTFGIGLLETLSMVNSQRMVMQFYFCIGNPLPIQVVAENGVTFLLNIFLCKTFFLNALISIDIHQGS